MTDPAARQQFMQSPEFAKFQEAQKNGQHYQALVNSDDTIAVENIPAGDFEISVVVIPPPDNDASDAQGVRNLKPIVHGEIKFTVPAAPPSGTLDAGEVEMKAPPATP
jgi:hypothetical protein